MNRQKEKNIHGLAPPMSLAGATTGRRRNATKAAAAIEIFMVASDVLLGGWIGFEREWREEVFI